MWQHSYDYLRSDSGIVRGGFLEAGIVEALDQAEAEKHSDDDPFDDLD